MSLTLNVAYFATGWQRCLACLKLQVSFRKRATHCRALLRRISYTQCWIRRSCTQCLELQVSSHKRATNYRALLRKMTTKDKVFNASLQPCNSMLKKGGASGFIFTGYLPQKNPIISGSLMERDLQRKACYASGLHCSEVCNIEC